MIKSTLKIRNIHVLQMIVAQMILSTIVSQTAYARDMKLCITVDAEFIDSGGPEREDHFSEEGSDHDYPARYADIMLKETGAADADALWNGYLDGDGCTDPIDFEASTGYEVRLQTRVGKSGDRTIEIPQDGDASCGYFCADSNSHFAVTETFATLADLESGSGDKMMINFDWSGPRQNLLVMAGWLLYKSDLGYPSNTSTIIKIDGTDACYNEGMGGAYNSGSRGHLCVQSTNTTGGDRYAMSAGAYYKFVVGHELGHRVQYAHNVDIPAAGTNGNMYSGAVSNGVWVDDLSYPANDPDTNSEHCKCDMVEPRDGSPAHCFQSRETVQDAMGEGFGHFFAAAMFNERPDDGDFDYQDCWFAYCKQGWAWFAVGNDFTFFAIDESPPVFHHCSNIRPGARPEYPVKQFPYMNDFCDPGDEDVGVERSWLSLFWRMYSDDDGLPGDKRFRVSDILEAFGTGDGHYRFQKTYDEVKALWDDPLEVDRFDKFLLFAQEEGVNHCENGCVY